MTALEIVLLLIGAICVIASFIFSAKFDGGASGTPVNVELTDKQKNDIKKQISKAFDEKMEEMKADISNKTEIELEKLSNQKIKELSEYSETVLSQINKNHSEAMFLYDMLNEKNKEVHNNIRDIETATKKAKEEAKTKESVNSVDTTEPATEPVTEPVAIKKEPAVKPAKEVKVADKTVNKQAEKVKSAAEAKKDLEDAVKKSGAKKDERPAKKAKKAEDDYLAQVALASEDELSDTSFTMGGNKKDSILELHNAGKSNVEIAKILGLGIGEVKLVLDLYKGKK